MSYWSWDPSLSVGIDIIDGQHRRIVEYINDLYVAKLEGDQAKVTQVLLGLIDYTRTHFTFEEELMRQAGYPLSAEHKKVHDSFVGLIGRYAEAHVSGIDVTRKLMSELQIWLTNHIKNDDRDYAPHAAKHMKQGWVSKTLRRFFG